MKKPRNKTHIFSSPFPVRPEEWQGVTCPCLCGVTIHDARPVFEFNLEDGEIRSARTLDFCHKCLVIALSPVSGKRYIYGVLQAEEAHRVNQDLEI